MTLGGLVLGTTALAGTEGVSSSTPPPPPLSFDATDHIIDAPDVSVGGTVFSGRAPWDNTAATNPDPNDPSGAFTHLVWHKCFIPAAGTCTFQDDPTGAFADTYMYLYSGPPDAVDATGFTLLSYGDDNAGNGRPLVTYLASGGEWLYIAHTGYSGGQYSGQTMMWSIPVAGLTGTITGSTDLTHSTLAHFVTFEVQGTVGVAVTQGFFITAQVLSSKTVDNPKQYEPDAQPTIHFV